MKITQVISDENIGGAGILLSLITEGLREEFDFEILLPRGSMLKTRLPSGVRIKEVPMHGASSLSDILYFYRYFKKNPCDLLHTHAAFSARLGGALAGIARLYSTRHCAMGAREIPPLYRNLYDRITTMTVATAAAAEEELIREGVPKEKIRLIYNGTKEPPRISEAQKRKVRHALGIGEEDTVIGCVGRLHRVKGQDLLLHAAHTLQKRLPHLHLVFVGDGSERKNLEALAARLSIEKSVHFVGYTDTPYLYQNIFDLNVNPSRGTETSCLATSECAALGIPTVASDFGGNRECVAHEVSGLIFRSEDIEGLTAAIEKALCDRELSRLLKRGARKRYETMFTLSHMLDGYRRLYSEKNS